MVRRTVSVTSVTPTKDGWTSLGWSAPSVSTVVGIGLVDTVRDIGTDTAINHKLSATTVGSWCGIFLLVKTLSFIWISKKSKKTWIYTINRGDVLGFIHAHSTPTHKPSSPFLAFHSLFQFIIHVLYRSFAISVSIWILGGVTTSIRARTCSMRNIHNVHSIYMWQVFF